MTRRGRSGLPTRNVSSVFHCLPRSSKVHQLRSGHGHMVCKCREFRGQCRSRTSRSKASGVRTRGYHVPSNTSAHPSRTFMTAGKPSPPPKSVIFGRLEPPC
ncbi:hypothetical protein C8Q74DRAFT_645419 [Fomes fomentarius]|nr:hypothetical protein C8Q74DRAFT_645419 [Fomes fomentarius]